MFGEARVYGDYDSRPEHYRQNLWKVNHDEFQNSRRFVNESSVYLEAISEAGQAPLEAAPVPRGMVKFMEWMAQKFGVGPSQFSSYTDIAHNIMCFLDYTEPYYLFVNSCVQIVPNQLKYTYRLKNSRSILPPNQIEVFAIMPGWQFTAYKNSMSLLDHPVTQAVLRGEQVRHSTRGDLVTTEDILGKISQLVWGDPGFIHCWVDEWLDSFYTNMNVSVMQDDLAMSLESFMHHDRKFWHVVAVAGLLWFRSEHALPFLCEYHPIYYSVLGWNKESGAPYVIPGSGGEAIVAGWDVYNHLHVTAEKNSPPGSCDCCQSTLHCTKLVNATAVAHPVCYCGKDVEILDFDLEDHTVGYSESCRVYRKDHPPVQAYACQRCLGMYVKQRAPDLACEHSTTCPDTSCNWHGGAGLYIRNLTDKRRMLLTHKAAK